MTTEQAMLDSALRGWKQNIVRASRFFSGLSEEQLQHEVAPGKNRLIYLWGHLTAIHDGLLPLLGAGDRLHPELEAIYLTSADRASETELSPAALKQAWDEINTALDAAFEALTPEQWVERHTAVSPEDFAKEPHRNRFTLLLGRTAHLAYHFGQAKLA